MTSRKITVLVADDHTIVREGLKSLISGEKDMEVVADVDTGRAAVGAASKIHPDVAVLDIAMPLLNGIDAVAQIRRTCPGTATVLLSMHAEMEYVHRAVEAGASAYLIKHRAVSELLTAIREVAKGNAYFSPAVNKFLVGDFRSQARGGGPGNGQPHALTQREREVLQLVAEGYSNKEMATELSISVKTIEKHRQSVMNKLEIHTIAGLTRYAMERGLTARPN
ncbi:MAG: response regulator transcription factor [Nitrospirae bacterium]|nr:response regulator transcription factor [Nitrospirota bacterium]